MCVCVCVCVCIYAFMFILHDHPFVICLRLILNYSKRKYNEMSSNNCFNKFILKNNYVHYSLIFT